MEPSLNHVILTEGADLYRDIRKLRTIWREAIQGHEVTTTVSASHRSKRPFSPLHAYYPLLFHSLFREVPVETVRELARADRLYSEHLLSYDRILDHRKPADTADLFLAQLEHMQSLKRLYTLFPEGHSFWDYFSACYFETWKSLREEKLWHSHRIGTFSLRRFCDLAKGKTAVLKPFTMALVFVTGRTELMPRLAASLDQHHIALVLIDDLEDWRQDFLNFNFTYLLTRLLQDAHLAEEVRSGRPVSPATAGRLLYASGRMEKQLRLAEIFFRKSNKTVDTLPLPVWKQFNNGFRARYRALRHDLAEIRRREEVRTRMRALLGRESRTAPGKRPVDPAVRQIRHGVRFLAACRAAGGAFPLSASPHAYMCPSHPIAPSKAVTTLILGAVEPVKVLDASLASLSRSVSLELCSLQDTVSLPALPAALESAFECLPSDPDQLARMDRSFLPRYAPLPNGLRWANYLCTCSRNGFHPPRISAYVADCLRRRWYAPWSLGVAFGPTASPWTRYECKPLLPLLLICRALGTELPRKDLQDYLLEPHRTPRQGRNTTESALILLCLLLTEYDGPEPAFAIDKISESQEPDGSWAPNAIYREGSLYYGSRELTTAWCLEALFRYQHRSRKRTGAQPNGPEQQGLNT